MLKNRWNIIIFMIRQRELLKNCYSSFLVQNFTFWMKYHNNEILMKTINVYNNKWNSHVFKLINIPNHVFLNHISIPKRHWSKYDGR